MPAMGILVGPALLGVVVVMQLLQEERGGKHGFVRYPTAAWGRIARRLLQNSKGTDKKASGLGGSSTNLLAHSG